MSCCFQNTSNGTCGTSTSTVTIPQNAILSPVICSLPCVREFSTSIARFNNQIIRDVLTALSKRCQALTPPTLPPGTLVLLSDMTTFDQTLSTTITLEIPGLTMNSTSITLRNVSFTIIGFASVLVRVSGEAVITIAFQGVDDLPHTQTAVVPFAFTVTVPGDFPTNVVAQGNLSVNNQLMVTETDPSALTITAVSVTLFFATNIMILLPAV